MKNRMAAFGVGLCLVLLSPIAPTIAGEVKLHIPPVFQERPSWCWAAVGEMIFKYYYVPAVHRTDYQCGIVQTRNLCAGIPNCVKCDLPPGDESTMMNMLQQYSLLATRGGAAGDIALAAQSKAGSLSEEEVKHEINEGRPIIAGVSPSGFKIDGISQHTALIVGYDDRSGDLKLIVNDPFPFEDDRFLWIGNPYQPNMDMSEENEGQYEVGFQRFRSKIKWIHTMYRITCTGKGCPSDNLQAEGSITGKDDREVIQSVLAAASETSKPYAPDIKRSIILGQHGDPTCSSPVPSNVW